MESFVLSKLPPSVNESRRINPAGAKQLSRWTTASGWEMRTQPCKPLTDGPFAVRVLVHPKRTKCDLDNVLKGCIDLLHKMHFTDDDKHMVALHAGFDSSIDGAVQVMYWLEEKARDEL